MPRPRSHLARQKALDATTQLLVDGGLGAVNYDAVAAASGVAKTTLYRHWPDRDGLILDAVNEHYHDLTVPDTGTFRGDLLEYFEHARREEFAGTRADLFPSVLEAAQRDPRMQSLVDRIADDRRRRLAEVIANARRRGELTTALDDETLVSLIVGPLIFRKLVRKLPITPRFIRSCLEVVLNGLGFAEPDGPPKR